MTEFQGWLMLAGLAALIGGVSQHGKDNASEMVFGILLNVFALTGIAMFFF